MSVSITPLLADRLDISEEQAQSLLETMLRELRRRAESDNVRLPELGTFREEGGTLTFEPSPSLRRLVNHQYEGLSAEDLSVPEAAEASSLATSEPALEKEPSKAAAAPAAEPEPASRGSTVDSFTLISLVLALLFVLGAGWFVLDQTNVLPLGPGDSPPVASEQTPEDPAPGAASDTADDQSADSDTAGIQPPDTASVGSGGAQDNREATAPTSRNWIIVVASRSSRAAADAAADEYKSRFDSVEVIAGTANDRTWYRVAVGRYASAEAAKRALNEQASRLPPGAWLHHLR